MLWYYQICWEDESAGLPSLTRAPETIDESSLACCRKRLASVTDQSRWSKVQRNDDDMTGTKDGAKDEAMRTRGKDLEGA